MSKNPKNFTRNDIWRQTLVLDINRFVCFWRILKRRILNNRIDKLDNCEAKIDLPLIKWVLWDYPRTGRKMIKKFLEKYNDKKVIIIKSGRDLENIEEEMEIIKASFEARRNINVTKAMNEKEAIDYLYSL